MDNDVNMAGNVTQSGVVDAAPTQEQSVNTEVATETSVEQTADVTQQAAQVATETLADGTSTQKDVPYSRFSEVNSENSTLKAELDRLRGYVQAQQQPTQLQQTQESITQQVIRELGYDAEGFLTAKEQATVTDTVMARMQAQTAQQMQTQTFIASKPDYAKVVGTTDPLTGQFVTAPPLARVLQTNPMLAQSLNGPNGPMLAYELASKDPTYLAEVAAANKPPVEQLSQKADAVIKQANSIGSVSSVQGGGTIDKATQLQGMSDDEFKAYQQKVAPGIGTY